MTHTRITLYVTSQKGVRQNTNIVEMSFYSDLNIDNIRAFAAGCAEAAKYRTHLKSPTVKYTCDVDTVRVASEEV